MPKVRVYVIETEIHERTLFAALQRTILLASQKVPRPSALAPVPAAPVDLWDSKVQPWLSGREQVSLDEVLTKCLATPARSIKQSHRNRVAAILTRAGWRKSRISGSGGRLHVYRPYTFEAQAAAALAKERAQGAKRGKRS